MTLPLWSLLPLPAAALVLSLTACTSTNRAATSAPNPMTTAHTFQFGRSKTQSIQYLLFLPKGYEAESSKRWPLLLFLHGSGERGTNVWKVATHGPLKLAKDQPDFPFIIVAPQCPAGQIWSNDILLTLLDENLRQCAVDTNRVYLTGLSMGGYGTWGLGLAYPERFAAIVPICGGGDLLGLLLSSREKAQALHSLGVWAFHGAKDNVVPPAESQRMVDALKQADVPDVKLTIYPEAQHDSWSETYRNPDLYRWLLEHRRG